jgi:hypothetical protein
MMARLCTLAFGSFSQASAHFVAEDIDHLISEWD